MRVLHQRGHISVSTRWISGHADVSVSNGSSCSVRLGCNMWQSAEGCMSSLWRQNAAFTSFFKFNKVTYVSSAQKSVNLHVMSNFVYPGGKQRVGVVCATNSNKSKYSLRHDLFIALCKLANSSGKLFRSVSQHRLESYESHLWKSSLVKCSLKLLYFRMKREWTQLSKDLPTALSCEGGGRRGGRKKARESEWETASVAEGEDKSTPKAIWK